MSKFKFREKKAAFNALKRVMLDKITDNSVIFFRDKVFAAQGFIDKGIERWAPTKRGGTILVKTGAGKASIHKVRPGLVQAGKNYMTYHNEGTNKMPQRKFMGDSEALRAENRNIIMQHLNKL